MVATSKGREIQKKKLKLHMKTVLMIRQFQPAHSALITELCGESFVSFSNAAFPFFTLS